jgi:signal transduction histidine kinase
MHGNRYIILLTWLILAFRPLAQSQPDIDSLRTQLTLAHSDTVYVDVLNQMSQACRWSHPSDAIDYAVKAEKISQNCSYHQGLALAYYNLGSLYADKGSSELSLEYYGKSLQIYNNYHNNKKIALLYDSMGIIFTRQLNYEKALDFYNRSLNLKKWLNDTLGLAYSYENIGIIYADQGKYDKALINYYNCLRLKESLNNKYGIANTYGYIGAIYLKIGSFDQAQVNLERALLLFLETGNQTGIAESQLYLSEIYSKNKDYPKAVDALEQSISINSQKGNLKGLADAYLRLGRIHIIRKKDNLAHDYYLKSLNYYQQSKEDKGIVEVKLALAHYYCQQGDYETAKMQLKGALQLTGPLNFAELELEATKMLASIYKNEYNFIKTTELLYRAIELSDTLNKLNLDKEVTQVQMQYEFDKKILQKEFEESHHRLESEQKVKRIGLIRNITLVAFLLLLLLSLVIYRNSRKLKIQNKLLEEQQKIINQNIAELTAQKIQLEKANQTKDKFLAIIGHDLRNPFNAINGFVAKVMEHPQQTEEGTMEKYLQLIKDAGSSAQSLLENLLEWAKNQSGELHAKKEKITLNYILRGNMLLIKEMATQKRITLTEELEGNPLVVIDKNMINAVIRNLLSNALKFTLNGGTIMVNTTIKESEVKVAISDTGIGISPEQLSILFEPNTIKNGVGGIGTSGLGLILCKEFLEKHQQELRVESVVDGGTVFWFYLPLTD